MLHELQIHRQILYNLAAHYLEPMGGMFERLNYLASLRDPSSGNYQHERLGCVYGELPVSEALARAHEEAFEALLEIPLAQQEQDLRKFLGSADVKFTPLNLQDECHRWIPPGAADYLKDLFRSNLSALQELVRDAPTEAGSSN